MSVAGNSRKRVKQSKKNVKSHVFLDFQKTIKRKNVTVITCIVALVGLKF